ncbi:SdpI family protein [Clostridium tyrobutyricum]|uniref:SdpI family protein n=1 Tax=Clostridium tyrobutyricum TaxID=1519 RepID=UPI00189F2A10|nr:SdpI family protein [Clostridium tyrobutyricum]
MGLLSICLMGIFIIIIGLVLKLYSSKYKNKSIGYRTSFAMKNKETWYEANRFFGFMIVLTGIFFTLFSIFISYLTILEQSLQLRISIVILFILFINIIFYTEVHLRKLFDENGNRKIL